MRLGLVAIVKNEAENIVKTLESFRPFVDGYCILDTGSTDNTSELIVNSVGELGLKLFSESFTDFSTSRNRVLELSDKECDFDYVIMVSGDDLAVREIGQFNNLSKDAYLVKRTIGVESYYQAMIIRCNSGWRYRGKTHEVILGPKGQIATEKLEGLTINKLPSSKTQGARWWLDAELLLSEHNSNPQDARTCFYLAQTFECLNLYSQAEHFYRKRVEIGGWIEEKYEAQYRIGRCLSKLGKPSIEEYIKAYSIYPRPEPLLAIAQVCMVMRDIKGAKLFAKMASNTEHPSEAILFVNPNAKRIASALAASLDKI